VVSHVIGNMTKIETMYSDTVASLAALQPQADDFERKLDELISLLIKIKYAAHQRGIKADGSVDWLVTDEFLIQVEAGHHRYGVVSGWQGKESTK
jgi:hypothetical protein